MHRVYFNCSIHVAVNCPASNTGINCLIRTCIVYSYLLLQHIQLLAKIVNYHIQFRRTNVNFAYMVINGNMNNSISVVLTLNDGHNSFGSVCGFIPCHHTIPVHMQHSGIKNIKYHHDMLPLSQQGQQAMDRHFSDKFFHLTLSASSLYCPGQQGLYYHTVTTPRELLENTSAWKSTRQDIK